jgi:hypothetical protein
VFILRGWQVLALSARRQPGGSWSYRYSLAPGIVATVTVPASPDAMGLADEGWRPILEHATRPGTRYP